MSRFFIDRPRFALVISLVITLAGIISYLALPIERFPNLSPPVVEVSTTYPGASAKVVEQTVTSLLEEEINGVPRMLYMNSVSSDDGGCKISVTFEIGTDIDQAAVLVQNRIQKAIPSLPNEVKREGVVVEAASPNMLVIVHLESEDPAHDELFLSNYSVINVKDALARVPGVGRIELLGAREYGMRVWLDPDRMRGFQMGTDEVIDAIVAQNMLLAGGRIGAAPSPESQRFQFSVIMPDRLLSAEEFGQVIVRTRPEDGSVIRVKDVAEVELGAQNYDITSRLDGEATASMIAYQLPGSNALEAVKGIEAEMDRLSKAFPEGLKWRTSYNSTLVVEASIEEMMVTLYVAVGLVILVVFVFLGGIRPTLVPAAAVPVSLIGTFALMTALGFSMNTLSLFGLILAIGVVVDDAILVVETATRNIEEHGMQPKEASIAAMQEVSGAVIASTLVLMAVFVPVAFIPGLTGRLFQQFALTISASVAVSTINALSLSPALSSLVLAKPGAKPTWVARSFNRVFHPIRKYYVGAVGWTLARKALVPIALLGVLGGTVGLSRIVPTGFLPIEDDGVLMMQVTLPEAASTNRTLEVAERVGAIAGEQDGVSEVIVFSGYDFLTGAVTSNTALVIAVFHEWSERKKPEQKLAAVKKRIDAQTKEILDASVFSFQLPAIEGLGMTAGLDLELQDRGAIGSRTLSEVGGDLAAFARAQPSVGHAVSLFRAEVPQVRVSFDREQVARMKVPLQNIQDTLSSNLSPRYIDDMLLFGRTFRVLVSSRGAAAGRPRELLNLTTQSIDGNQIPLGTVATLDLEGGPSFITRFNLYPSSRITIVPAPGRSSGEIMSMMEQIADATLGPEFGYDWSGAANEEKKAGNATAAVFVLSIVFAYLFLTAQYESFTTPISVMLMVPTAVFGAFLTQWAVGLPIDLYTQVGLVLLVGLTAKTAILLVELSKQQYESGMPLEKAVLEAANLRFRAVLMTAGTFILGMLPLLVATGAGAASRFSLGCAVTGGAVAGIICTLFFVPRLFVIVTSTVDWLTRKKKTDEVAS